MPKKKKRVKKKKTNDKTEDNTEDTTNDVQERPEEVIPELYCDLKDISYVLLILCSPTYEQKYPNIKILLKIIKIAVAILLSENKEPIQLSDKKTQKNINTKLNNIKKTDVYKNYIKPYVETYKNNITEGAKQLFLLVNIIINSLEPYTRNDGGSKEASFKFLAFIGYVIKSLFKNIAEIPVFKFTQKFGSIFFNFFIPKPKTLSCGRTEPSYHPSALLDSFIGDSPCKDLNTEESQILCKQWDILEASKLDDLTGKVMDYNTNDRGDYLSKLGKEIINFFQSSDEGGDSDDLFKKNLEELDTLQICSNENGTIKQFICNLEKEKTAEPVTEKTLDTSSSQSLSSAPVNTTKTPIVTGGGIKPLDLYGGFSQFSNIDKNIVYNHINHFTDTSSLKGIYILHQYNKYLNTN